MVLLHALFSSNLNLRFTSSFLPLTFSFRHNLVRPSPPPFQNGYPIPTPGDRVVAPVPPSVAAVGPNFLPPCQPCERAPPVVTTTTARHAPGVRVRGACQRVTTPISPPTPLRRPPQRRTRSPQPPAGAPIADKTRQRDGDGRRVTPGTSWCCSGRFRCCCPARGPLTKRHRRTTGVGRPA